MTEKILTDDELGTIVIRVHPRAVRLTFRAKDDGICISVPSGTKLSYIRQCIEELRPKLVRSLVRKQRKEINERFRIETDFFRLSIVKGRFSKFEVREAVPRSVEIICPPDTEFSDATLQEWLQKAVVEVMRRCAKQCLPDKLKTLSQRHGFDYRRVQINSSRSRWGSCSAQGNINLSCYLLLLPERLIDYVLLHELCHTEEMNHSPRFWAWMDKVTEGKAKTLRQELRAYRTDITT